MRERPSQKTGMEMPPTDRSVTNRSQLVPRFEAANTPVPMPMTDAKSIAVSASLAVFGNFWSRSSVT